MLDDALSVRKISVAGFGSVVLDVLMVTDEIVLERKNHVEQQTIQVGGVVPTALITLSRLGISTKIHTVVGDDLFSQALISIFEKERVSLGNILKVKKKETPLAFVVIHKKTGHRTNFYTTGDFSSLPEDTFSQILDSSTDYLLVDGHYNLITHDLMQKAKRKGIKILLDLGNPKEGIARLISDANTIFVPKAYWNVVWPEKKPQDIVKLLLQSGPQLVVLTMEEKGCLVGQGAKIFYQPAYTVKAVDTNGAGDVFFGAFTYGMTQSWSLEKTAQFASAAAARSCTVIGKDLKIPHTVKEVDNFIEANKLTTHFSY